MIVLEKLTFKNFLSYGNNVTELVFDTKGTILIKGENLDDSQTIGSNGCGKCLRKNTQIEIMMDDDTYDEFISFLKSNT